LSEHRHKRSVPSFRRSSAGGSFLAGTVGLLVGAASAVLLVAGGGLLGASLSGAWLAATAPIACALLAAAATGSLAHWRKVSGRGAVIGLVMTTALLVLLGLQLVDIAGLAAWVEARGVEVLADLDVWRGSVDGAVLVELGARAPGVVAAAAMVGEENVWMFAVGALVLVLAMAAWMAARALSAPLCLSCRAWCVRQRGVVERSGEAAPLEVVRQRATARDWRYIRDLGPARGGASLRFDLSRCPRCSRSNALDVMVERPLWRDRRVVEDLRLHHDDVRTLLDLIAAEPKPV
jgi:hypothetical protein